jgi:4-aminobutyrate aminotransferase-like enzyme
MSGGLPISACIGRAEVMDAWPVSTGEAIHTQTFLGHPLGCAAALAAIGAIESERLVERAADVGAAAREQLERALSGCEHVVAVRGRGLVLAAEYANAEHAAAACRGALERGVIALLAGDDGTVLSLTPPLDIASELLDLAIDRIAEASR